MKWFYELYLSLLVGSTVVAVCAVIFAFLSLVVTHLTHVLSVLAFLACVTGLGYIIRYYTIKK